MKILPVRSLAPIRPKAHGFTLVELMVVVAIAGILAAVAFPSYNSYVRKSRRSDAVTAMMRVLQAQERWRANNPSYTNTLSNLNLTAASDGGYYTLSIPSASASSYTLRATAVTGRSQAADTGCTPLNIAVANGTPTYNEPACWNR